MGLLAFVKDKVGDAFGIFDDLQDYKDFLRSKQAEVERKARVAKSSFGALEREILVANSADDFETEKIKKLRTLLRDIRQDLAESARETDKLRSKASRSPEIKNKVGAELDKFSRDLAKLLRDYDDTEQSLQDAEKESREFAEALETDEDVERARRKLASTLGRAAGAGAAVVGIGVLISRFARVF